MQPYALHSMVRRSRVLMLIGIAICATSFAPVASAERIKDLASVQGVQSNALIGYGLVVGLDGTGDQTTQAPFPTQSLRSMLNQLGD